MGEVAAILGDHRLVGLDSSIFIYQFESDYYPNFAPLAQEFFELAQSGQIEAVTSTVTLAEITVVPYRLGMTELAYQYGYVLRTMPHLRLVDIDYRIADRAAFLRAKYGLKTPDALQIGAAIASGATAFLTADRELARAGQEITVTVLKPPEQPQA